MMGWIRPKMTEKFLNGMLRVKSTNQPNLFASESFGLKLAYTAINEHTTTHNLQD